MTTRAVEGITLYKAAFGRKPDLKEMHEWGRKVYVQIESEMKLGGRVCEGKWLDIDEESKGMRAYWPDMRNITVE